MLCRASMLGKKSLEAKNTAGRSCVVEEVEDASCLSRCVASTNWRDYLWATPASLHSASNDRQNGPTGGGYYHLTDDRTEVDARQGRDQDLEDQCTDNATYCSGNRVSRA